MIFLVTAPSSLGNFTPEQYRPECNWKIYKFEYAKTLYHIGM